MFLNCTYLSASNFFTPFCEIYLLVQIYQAQKHVAGVGESPGVTESTDYGL